MLLLGSVFLDRIVVTRGSPDGAENACLVVDAPSACQDALNRQTVKAGSPQVANCHLISGYRTNSQSPS
jgi:hypothetical protein